MMPAPAAVKGSACGPLRALDRFGRGHGVADTTVGRTRVQRESSPPVPRAQRYGAHGSPADNRDRGRHMTGAGVQEHRFLVRPRGTADSDDDPQPDIAQHPDGFRMLLAALPRMIVIGARPCAMGQTAVRKLPERFPQGMDTGATKVDGANGRALSGDRRGTCLALGDAGILIPVAIVAQFSHHPGGEKVTSAGQAAVELAVRVECQYPSNLPIVRIDMGGEASGAAPPSVPARRAFARMTGGAM